MGIVVIESDNAVSDLVTPLVLYLQQVSYRGNAMGRANILVVEDSFVVARRLQLSLERAGFHVDTARNGREAWRKAQRKQYDAIVTDERMPVMSGREFCRLVRKESRYQHTPIVFLTADPKELNEDELIDELGVSTIFEKPFHPEAILHVIENELVAARTG